jgi:hypothetical protein
VTDYDKLIGTEGLHAAEGAVVAPLLRLYLSRGDFPTGKKLEMPGLGSREPDGWFHPSSHPTMDERKLYHYLAEPKLWVPEDFSFELRMSVTVGTLMHGIVQVILEDLGLWQMPTGTCPCCNRPHGRRRGQCSEPGVWDPVLGRRGHMDGVLLTKQFGMVGYDLKTMNHFSIAKMPDMDCDYMRAKHPYYYGQMQEYMALSGLRMMVMVFMGMGLPWHIREVQVPYDEQYVMELEAKYRRVRAAVAAGQPPDPCCGPRTPQSKSCSASNCYIKKI